MTEPIVLPINATNELRVYRDRNWGNLDLVHVRRYYRANDGSMAPTSKGVTIAFERVAELIQALETVRGQPSAA